MTKARPGVTVFKDSGSEENILDSNDEESLQEYEEHDMVDVLAHNPF